MGSRRAWDAAAIALGLLVCAATLSPAARHSGAPTDLGPDSPSLADALRNLVLLAPLAVALVLAGHRRLPSLALCAGFSAGIELLQFAIPGRTSSLADLVCNSLGAGVAIALYATRRAWLAPPRRVAALLCALAVAAVWSALALGGWLAAPEVPVGQYYGGWTPDISGMARHPGRVLEARIGASAIAVAGPVADPVALRAALVAASPIHVRWRGASAAQQLAPLVILIGPASEEVLLVAERRPDLVLRRWRRAARVLLEQPELVWPGALAGLGAQGEAELTATFDASGVSLVLDHGEPRHIGLGPGRGWALLAPDRWVRPGLQPALDALWLAILLFPVGLWLPPGPGGALVALLALAALWFVPAPFGLIAASSGEWFGALAGLVAGRASARAGAGAR